MNKSPHRRGTSTTAAAAASRRAELKSDTVFEAPPVRNDGSAASQKATAAPAPAPTDNASPSSRTSNATALLVRPKRANGVEHTKELLRQLISAVQDYAMFVIDVEGNVLTWNTGAERMKGYKASEIIGRNFENFYPEDQKAAGKPKRELEIAAREGRIEDEGWRIRKDGSRFWANVIITALRDEQGKLIGYGKVTRDFTERIRIQEALRGEIVEKNIAQRRLHESESALRRLSLHVLHTQDEERRRIGRELHDSVGQYLSVLKMKLDSMAVKADKGPPKNWVKDIADASHLLDESIKEVRTISYLLYPPLLEEMGLRSAIAWYVDGFTARSGIQTSFEAREDFGRLPQMAELTLFRILQESLTNVHRHSGSASAEVKLTREDHQAVLEVKDRGTGIPQETLDKAGPDYMGAPGVGLRGMNERLKQLGGRLEIESDSNGTTLIASVPSREEATTQ